MMARIARPLQSLRGAQWPQRATARCNYSAATLRRKTCVFPFARQREWMCQNYGHRATARCNYHAAEPRSKTCVFPFARQREWMCQNYGHRAQRDATTARLRRALTEDSLKRTRYRAFQLHAATPRHTRATRDTRSLRSLTAKSSYRRRFLILRCRLFLSLRSRIRQVLDCSPTNRERELGLDRRETG